MRDAVRRGRLARPGILSGRSRRSRDPLLSVVVPAYDVERYLPACLASIQAQPLYQADLVDVLIVDDGSPDRSGELAEEFAASEPSGRVRVIHQVNAGLGAARNAALPHVSTPYLTFLDSDDTLPEDAWTRMLDTIRETGSDMVIGKLVRVAGQQHTVGRWMEVNHRRMRLRTTVERTPEILADVFAVNKIFRRDFWDASMLTFGEDVRYEDQPTLTGAMLLAKSIDVLPYTVYHWRTRVDGTSITQCRRDMKDITDRVATKLDSLAMVRDYAAVRDHHHVTRVFLTKVLPVDMWEYFRGSVGNSDAYWQTLRQGMHAIWDEVPFHASIVPVQQRLMGWLVTHDRQADLKRFLDWLECTPPRERVREGLLLHPFRDEPGLPSEVTRVRHAQPQLLAV